MSASRSELHRQECLRLRKAAILAIKDCVLWLEQGSKSEAEATEFLVSRLALYGVSSYWYPSGEAADPQTQQRGTIIAFDTEAHPQRTLFQNARSLLPLRSNCWEGIGYFYASPFSTFSVTGGVVGALGDFAATIYLGHDQGIMNQFRKRWALQEKLLSYLKKNPEATTRYLYNTYTKISSDLGLENIAISLTGPLVGQANTNIGHSFPLEVSPGSVPLEDIARRCSDSRIFVDGSTNIPLRGNLWSVESRDRSVGYQYGSISFHDVVEATNLGIVPMTDFLSFFGEVGMNWVIS